jgi:hypothetical protein
MRLLGRARDDAALSWTPAVASRAMVRDGCGEVGWIWRPRRMPLRYGVYRYTRYLSLKNKQQERHTTMLMF